MAPKKKVPSKFGKRKLSREELSVLGMKRRLEDDLDADQWFGGRPKGKGGDPEDEIWDDPSLYDESNWDEEGEQEFF